MKLNLLGSLCVVLIPCVASANSTGIAGYSGQNQTTCTFCHQSAGAINAAINGPSFLKLGAKGIYTLTMAAFTGVHKVSGVDVSASEGHPLGRSLRARRQDPQRRAGPLRSQEARRLTPVVLEDASSTRRVPKTSPRPGPGAQSPNRSRGQRG
jgi:hypothetical protein